MGISEVGKEKKRKRKLPGELTTAKTTKRFRVSQVKLAKKPRGRCTVSERGDTRNPESQRAKADLKNRKDFQNRRK